MTITIETQPNKYFKLNYGYFLVIFGILILIIPFRTLFPPEASLPVSSQPFWLANASVNFTVVILSVLTLITAIFAIVYGIHDILIGLKEQEEYFSKENFVSEFIHKIESDKKFMIFSVYTFMWLIIWIINTLSVKLGPIDLPLYFLRQSILQRNLPDVPVSELPVYSSYNFIGIGMDFGMFMIFLYFIYVYVRPGIQKMEYLVDYLFKSNLFFALLILITGLHLIGHLPLEFYGRFGGFESGLVSEPETGLGQDFLEGWFAFDKVTHYLSSLLLLIIIVPFVIEQQKFAIPEEIEQYRESLKKPNQFIYLTALTYLIMLGVLWEFAELVLNIVMFQLGAINIDHFNVEYNDALKDLVFDFLGGISGIIITIIDYKYSLRS